MGDVQIGNRSCNLFKPLLISQNYLNKPSLTYDVESGDFFIGDSQSCQTSRTKMIELVDNSVRLLQKLVSGEVKQIRHYATPRLKHPSVSERVKRQTWIIMYGLTAIDSTISHTNTMETHVLVGYCLVEWIPNCGSKHRRPD